MQADKHDPGGLEQRLTATRAVHQVVGAIWAMARAQLPVAEAAAGEVVAYLREVEEVVARLAGPAEPSGPAGRTLRVLMGPERGWCGALPRELITQLPPDGELGLVGHRLSEVALEDEALRPRVRFVLPGATTADEAPQVARAVAEAVLAWLDATRVELWHPVDGTAQLATAMLLGGVRARRHLAPATLSPWEQVLKAAVFEAVTGRLAVGAIEALRSEARARVGAASQARAAAERRLEALQQAFHVARQEQITTELLELVAGGIATRGG
jgi:F-type H+-transporting ATPase subunit gamma